MLIGSGFKISLLGVFDRYKSVSEKTVVKAINKVTCNAGRPMGTYVVHSSTVDRETNL